MNISHQSPQGPDRPNSPRDLGREGRKRINEGGKQVDRAREASAREAADQVERVRSSRTNAQKRISTDRIDLSATARSFGGEQVETAAQRAERVEELKQLSLRGKLNTPERAEESAAKILGSE
jgi:anti-sigma28 factor (negative regulator of flagellin synthesis)